ncbi:unnamed protein product, partial [Mesorhabditis spiculigera]
MCSTGSLLIDIEEDVEYCSPTKNGRGFIGGYKTPTSLKLLEHSSHEKKSPHDKLRATMGASGGLVVAGLAGAVGLGISLAAIPFVTPALRRVCIPYVPATPQQLSNLDVALSAVPNKAPLIDLGSGDGRVVLQCAERGIPSAGVELNAVLVAYSKWRALRTGMRSKASFYRMDLFKTDLTKYNTAVIFGAESLMDSLVPKLDEMRDGSRVLACRFPLPDHPRWQLTSQVGEGIDAVWVYVDNMEDCAAVGIGALACILTATVIEVLGVPRTKKVITELARRGSDITALHLLQDFLGQKWSVLSLSSLPSVLLRHALTLAAHHPDSVCRRFSCLPSSCPRFPSLNHAAEDVEEDAEEEATLAAAMLPHHPLADTPSPLNLEASLPRVPQSVMDLRLPPSGYAGPQPSIQPVFASAPQAQGGYAAGAQGGASSSGYASKAKGVPNHETLPDMVAMPELPLSRAIRF